MPIASTVAAFIPNELLLVAISLLLYFSFIAFLIGSYFFGSYILRRFSMVGPHLFYFLLDNVE